jgi:glyoxylase-like metal-dependent hydrolase (beta-lactamase superfamily II)
MKKFFLFLAVVSLCCTTLSAHSGYRTDETQQEINVKRTKLTDAIYLLQGRGGNIAALVGMEGILIVDDDYKAVSEKLRDALKELGSATPKFILNTHWHGDHTEGNYFFGKDSVIVAHVNVRKRLLDPPEIFGQKTPAYPSFALPIVTYTDTMSLNFDGEELRLIHFPSGHTDGDTVVFFTKSNVVHLGDDFFLNSFPFVDLVSGGSVQGLINNVGTLIKQMPADAQIIPGHGGMARLDDLKAFHQMLVDTSKVVQDEMKAGKTLDEIKKAGFPEKYKTWGAGFIKSDAWAETIYNSYAKK